MYVCHCRAVTDRSVRAAVLAGATTLDELAEGCGAGARCGGCRPLLAALLAGEATTPVRLATQPAA